MYIRSLNTLSTTTDCLNCFSFPLVSLLLSTLFFPHILLRLLALPSRLYVAILIGSWLGTGAPENPHAMQSMQLLSEQNKKPRTHVQHGDD